MDVRIVYLKLLFCVVLISLTLFVYVTFFCFFNVLFTLSWLFVAICNYVCPMSVLLFFSSQIQGVPENLCPVCLKIATKRQKVLTILLLDVALQMFN